MINAGLKIKDYLLESIELNEIVNSQIYNRFMDDETITEPFIIIDLNQSSIEDDINGDDYQSIEFTINILHFNYDGLIELSMLIQSLFKTDIECGDYQINTIKYLNYQETYNQVYIGKLTFSAKIN